MFGKVFDTMYTGSMVGAGPMVFALMPYAVTHCNADGLVEINPRLVSALIGAPVEDVEQALQYLMSPDPDSRSDAEEGRRLVKEGPFLYRLVNHAKYRNLQNAEDQRTHTRERVRRLRQKRKAVTECNADVTPSNAGNAIQRQRQRQRQKKNTISGGADISPERSPKRTPPDRPRPFRIAFDYATNEFTGIEEADWKRWSEAYPAVDCAIEAKRAAIWLRDNPAKRKKRVQVFLSRWFARCQERGGTHHRAPPAAQPDLRRQFDELWASKEQKP